MSLVLPKKPGALPATNDVVLSGVRLPKGLPISPFVQAGAAKAVPVIWVTDRKEPDVGGLWQKIAAGFAEHGLWPLVLDSRDDGDRPWLAGELEPSSSTSPDGHDALAFLEGRWNDCVPAEDEGPEALERFAPFGRNFPGLAAAVAEVTSADAFGETTESLEGQLGLVAIRRPADVPTIIGWMGPINHFADMGGLSALLRSWEDRFGAYLVGIGFDTLTIAVQRPPTTVEEAMAIAAEHYAACPDNIDQGIGSIDAYAEELVGLTNWTFWWD